MMKCQQCPNRAVIHITEIHGPQQVEDVHLCEECAAKYLQEKPLVPAPTPPPSAVNNKMCPACGLTFALFRSQGRFSCPHDYDAFAEEVLPLLENLHNATQHRGKSPQHRVAALSHQAELTRLRQQLQLLVREERYEEAARVRDRIRELEGS